MKDSEIEIYMNGLGIAFKGEYVNMSAKVTLLNNRHLDRFEVMMLLIDELSTIHDIYQMENLNLNLLGGKSFM